MFVRHHQQRERAAVALLHHDVCCSGVVSGTTVRALVLGRFNQKKIKIELKDNAKNELKNISYYKGVILWQFGPPMSALGLQ